MATRGGTNAFGCSGCQERVQYNVDAAGVKKPLALGIDRELLGRDKTTLVLLMIRIQTQMSPTVENDKRTEVEIRL